MKDDPKHYSDANNWLHVEYVAAWERGDHLKQRVIELLSRALEAYRYNPSIQTEEDAKVALQRAFERRD